MVIYHTSEPTAKGDPSPKSWWLYLLLGIVLLMGGVFVLGDLAFASVLTARFIAWAVAIVGACQIIHAFSAVGWKGFVFDLLLGVLYILAGALLLTNPLAATIKLTLLLGIIWIVSGLFRIVLGGVLWRQGGFSLVLSGIIGALAGGIILSEWPQSGLWVLGLCLGVDLIFHGFAWIGYSMSIPSKRGPQAA
jgi:uncharacterized membrane protein HdeD (DUF308 family)